MTLAAYLHDIDPFVIGRMGPRWYGLAYVAGFLGGYLLLWQLAKQRRILISEEKVADFVFSLILGTMLGGRIGYCVFYEPYLLTDFSASFPFWGALAFWQGGMASHGGIIGLIIASVLFARKHKITPYHLFDLVALTGPIGICLGRIANFINGELVGRPCGEDFPLAVKFPQEFLDWPTQRLDDLAKAVEPVGIQYMTRNQLLTDTLDAVQSGNVEVATAVAPLLQARHPSQLYAAGLEGLFLFVVLWFIWRKPRRPGVIGGWFLVLYAAVRILDEKYRMPDIGIGYQWLNLTRGQWLSVGMLLMGIGCLIWWSKRPVPPIGGWLGPAPAAEPNSTKEKKGNQKG